MKKFFPLLFLFFFSFCNTDAPKEEKENPAENVEANPAINNLVKVEAPKFCECSKDLIVLSKKQKEFLTQAEELDKIIAEEEEIITKALEKSKSAKVDKTKLEKARKEAEKLAAEIENLTTDVQKAGSEMEKCMDMENLKKREEAMSKKEKVLYRKLMENTLKETCPEIAKEFGFTE